MQVRDGQLVEVGSFGVRLMDVKTGQPAWEVASSVQPGEFEFLSMLELGTNAIYVAGSGGHDFIDSDSIVRAYDYGGNVIWEDRAYRSPNTQPHALTLSGRTLFVAGHVTQPDGVNADLLRSRLRRARPRSSRTRATRRRGFTTPNFQKANSQKANAQEATPQAHTKLGSWELGAAKPLKLSPCHFVRSHGSGSANAYSTLPPPNRTYCRPSSS